MVIFENKYLDNMKKTLLITSFVIIAAASFVGFRQLASPSAAIADQESGLFIFHKCKPASEYKYLGTVKTKGMVPDKEFETILGILIKRAKEEFPSGNGLIMRDWDADVVEIPQ